MKTRVWRWFRGQIRGMRTCPGLQPGWYQIANEQTWYSRLTCGRIMKNPVRAIYVGLCWDCVSAVFRRGFRINYENMERM